MAYHEIDCEGIIIRVNQAECELLGLTPGEMLGHHVWDFLAKGEREKSQAAILKKLAGEQSLCPFEREYLRHDGERITVEIHERLVRDRSGAVVGIRTAMLDVTERKRIDGELQKKNQELAVALVAAREAAELKSRFLANMSHEIRTPMNGVLGMAELLLSTPLSREQREYAQAVQSSGETLLTVINDILDFSKIEAGKLEIECIPFDPCAVVKEVAQLLALRARVKGLELTCTMHAAMPRLANGDPSRLRQVLTNLIGNAVKFTERGAVIVRTHVLRESPEETVILFAVEDTGIGVPPECCPRLFRSFVQGDSSTTRKFGGTGLGLAISKQLVELMGGEIGFESEPGKGSTFWFRLTFSIPREQCAAVPEGEIPFADTDQSEQTGSRVLLAEDNEINRKVAMLILQKAGVHADAVANGREALEAISRKHYDLVLMDVQMPEMDGFETTAAIRHLEQFKPRTPIIALTANAMSGDRERCLAAGMDDYLGKPVRLHDLRAAINRWLPSEKPSP